MRNLLCVGGTNAGKLVQVSGDENYVRMIEQTSIGRFPDITQQEIPKSDAMTMKTEIYRVERLYENKKEYEVLCREGVNLLQELINGYRPVVAIGARF